MLLAAIDPGAHPAYVLLDLEQAHPRRYFPRAGPLPLVVAAALAHPDWLSRAGAVATELQWFRRRRKASPKSILTLAFSAGWQLARACAYGATPLALDVDAWRAALGLDPGVPKEVAAARCARSLLPAETLLFARTGASPKRLADLYDAVMIGWAAFLQPAEYRSPP